MTRRSKQRAAVGLETLESRQVLSAAPTAELQYALELVNLTRTNPAAAAERITSNLSESTKETLDFYGVNLDQAKREIASSQSRQPLAWSDQLAAAAQAHSQDMANKGFQSHTGSDGSSPSDRIARAGYNDTVRSAENAFAYSESIDQSIQAFVLDWGVADKGHRRNILEPDNGGDDSFKEIGIAAVQSKRLGMGKVVTQNFGVRRGASAQLLGVVYNDRDKNGFYSIGEGQGDVTIEVSNASGVVATVESADAGGYQLALKPGNYEVRALVNGREVQSSDIRIGSKNVKVDVVTSATPAPTSTQPVSRPTPVAANSPTTSVKITKSPTTPKATAPVKVVTNTETPTTPKETVTAPVPVTILSNLTAPERPAPVVVPESVTFSNNTDGLTWNVWKAIPKVTRS